MASGQVAGKEHGIHHQFAPLLSLTMVQPPAAAEDEEGHRGDPTCQTSVVKLSIYSIEMVRRARMLIGMIGTILKYAVSGESGSCVNGALLASKTTLYCLPGLSTDKEKKLERT